MPKSIFDTKMITKYGVTLFQCQGHYIGQLLAVEGTLEYNVSSHMHNG